MFTITPKSDTTPAQILRFRAGLGNDTVTALKLSNSHPVGISRYAISEASGTFNLTGVCNQGGPRLLETDTKLFLGSAQPNPASTTAVIEFEMLQPDRAKLILFDMTGKPISTLLDEALIPGKHSVTISASELPAGVYFYVLTAGIDRKCGRMEVIR
jgi:hypothetical protein